MNQNPKNCRNNCPFLNTSDCPAIVFEQTEHMHGFATLAITVTGIIGCATYPEPDQDKAYQVIVQEPVAQSDETPLIEVVPVKKAAPCPGAPKKRK